MTKQAEQLRTRITKNIGFRFVLYLTSVVVVVVVRKMGSDTTLLINPYLAPIYQHKQTSPTKGQDRATLTEKGSKISRQSHTHKGGVNNIKTCGHTHII